MDGKDYYQILGVERSAGTSEIRRQYFAMAKQYHPDKGGGDTRMMTLLNEAYEVLASPQSRYSYNAELKRTEQTTAVASSVAEPETQVAYYYDDEAPHTYNAAEKRAARKAQRQARASRPQKRSWAGRVMSFATAVAMIVIAGAVIAGHLPTQGVTSALDLAPSQSDNLTMDTSGAATTPSAASNSGPTNNTIAGDPAAENTIGDPVTDMPTDTDGTLVPSTPAETHYRCTLHYIASYKRMNCN